MQKWKDKKMTGLNQRKSTKKNCKRWLMKRIIIWPSIFLRNRLLLLIHKQKQKDLLHYRPHQRIRRKLWKSWLRIIQTLSSNILLMWKAQRRRMVKNLNLQKWWLLEKLQVTNSQLEEWAWQPMTLFLQPTLLTALRFGKSIFSNIQKPTT